MTSAPLQFLLMVFAGWVNRRQVDVIDYLKEENQVLREQLGGRRLRFTNDQRRRLAVKGQVLGRRVLDEIAGLVTPENDSPLVPGPHRQEVRRHRWTRMASPRQHVQQSAARRQVRDGEPGLGLHQDPR